MRLGKCGVSHADDVGLVVPAFDAHAVGLAGAAPQKVGQLMLMMLDMLCAFGKTRGF